MIRYERQSKIDSGGFGCVYKAKRLKDGEIIAFKVLENEGLTKEDYRRFIREVRIQTQLDHPHIVPILGSDLAAKPPFFVMPLATGNLRSRIGRGDVSDLNSTSIFMQLLDGMAYAHGNGVIHRDLKPENVLFFDEDISGDELIRIADFGLGKRLDSESVVVTSSDVGMGTAAYMPPEQFRDFKHADERADIFSLGKILYEMITSELPVHVDTRHSKLPRGFGYVIGRCLEYDPNRRYQSILELKKDVLELTTEQRKFEHPQREIETLIRDIEDRPEDADNMVKKLDRLFLDNSDDEAFYTRHFVALGVECIRVFLEYSEERFLARLETFDDFVSGGLPWSFTDKVADFYRLVWSATDDERVHRIILHRLLDMGYWHNRWHVAGVFGEILASISQKEEGLMARDALLSNPAAAAWVKPYCAGGLLPVVRDGFQKKE